MEKKRACLKYLAANIGNIGVVGVGLAIFQNASVWAFLGGGASYLSGSLSYEEGIPMSYLYAFMVGFSLFCVGVFIVKYTD